MEVVTLASREVCGLIPTDEALSDVGYVLESVGVVHSDSRLLESPVMLRRYVSSHVIIDGHHRSAVSILSGRPLASNVYPAAEEVLAPGMPRPAHFRYIEERVGRGRNDGVTNMRELLLHEKTRKRVDEVRRRARHSGFNWKALERGLQAYDRFTGA